MADKIKTPTPITDEKLLERFFQELAEHIHQLENPPVVQLTPLQVDETKSEDFKVLATKINELIALIGSKNAV